MNLQSFTIYFIENHVTGENKTNICCFIKFVRQRNEVPDMTQNIVTYQPYIIWPIY